MNAGMQAAERVALYLMMNLGMNENKPICLAPMTRSYAAIFQEKKNI